MEIIVRTYEHLCRSPSDINEHLPTLLSCAEKCSSVLETGVRGCVSSWAILLGLLRNGQETKRMFMNDIDPCNIGQLLDANSKLPEPVDISYQWINNLSLELNETFDMVFIDTWHVYGQLKRELNKFAPITNKYIVMHDTTIDEIYGETIRCGFNAAQQSQISGFPIEEINCGLGKAVEEFLASHPEWKVAAKYTNNNGLTILERM